MEERISIRKWQKMKHQIKPCADQTVNPAIDRNVKLLSLAGRAYHALPGRQVQLLLHDTERLSEKRRPDSP